MVVRWSAVGAVESAMVKRLLSKFTIELMSSVTISDSVLGGMKFGWLVFFGSKKEFTAKAKFKFVQFFAFPLDSLACVHAGHN